MPMNNGSARGNRPRGAWRLVIRGKGYLKYYVDSELLFEVVVSARHARVLLLLIEARLADAASAAGTGGWRMRDDIASQIGAITGWKPRSETISRYASTIKRLTEAAWAQRGRDDNPPPLFESANGQGWRIPPTVEIKIEDPFF